MSTLTIILITILLIIFIICDSFYLLSSWGANEIQAFLGSLTITAFLMGLWRLVFTPLIKKHKLYLQSLLNKGDNFLHRLLSPVNRLKRELYDKKEALSGEEIRQSNIVRALCFIETFDADELVNTFEKNNLIKRVKVPGSTKKTYTFDSDMFFSPAENEIKNKLFAAFFDKCCDLDFQGIAILSRDGADYNRIFFKTGIENKTKIKNATIETIHANDTIIKVINPFSDLQKRDKVIILQLWDEKDDFLDMAYKYINERSPAKVIGAFTFFSSNLSRATKIGNGVNEIRFVKMKLP
jgi:hypothetical protein